MYNISEIKLKWHLLLDIVLRLIKNIIYNINENFNFFFFRNESRLYKYNVMF